jgi:hypothetical protein
VVASKEIHETGNSTQILILCVCACAWLTEALNVIRRETRLGNRSTRGVCGPELKKYRDTVLLEKACTQTHRLDLSAAPRVCVSVLTQLPNDLWFFVTLLYFYHLKKLGEARVKWKRQGDGVTNRALPIFSDRLINVWRLLSFWMGRHIIWYFRTFRKNLPSKLRGRIFDCPVSR